MKIKISILIIFILSLFSINSVEAKNNNFNFDDEVVISDKHEGTTFVGGTKVSVTDEATVDGVLFAMGEELSISGIDEYVFALGNNIKMDENESKDVFLLGNNIELNNIKVSRDLYILGNIVKINGEIDKDLYIASSNVKIEGIIHGDIHVAAPTIEIEKGTVITGKLIVPQDAKVNSKDKYNIETYKIKTAKKTFVDKLISVIISFTNVVIIGCLLFFILKKLNTKIDKLDKSVVSIVKTALFGCLAIVLSIFASLIFAILLVSKVCTIISIIGIALLLFIYYSSIVYSSYYLSNILLGNKINNRYILLTIGLLVLYLIKLIPVVGSIVFTIVSILGLGIEMKLLLKKEN